MSHKDAALDPQGEHVAYTRQALDLARAYERAVIRSRTRAALAAKKARGERIGTLPYGYRLAADGLHLAVDEAEQAVLASVRQLAGEGLSQRAIVVHLAGRGVVGRRGTPLQQTQVARMLRSA
jgi:DNA invertase Pin-like site-specific DNA recombinase